MKKVVAGILVGAGAVYAWNHLAHQSTPEAADEHRF